MTEGSIWKEIGDNKPFALLADLGVLMIKSSSSLPFQGELELIIAVKENREKKSKSFRSWEKVKSVERE